MYKLKASKDMLKKVNRPSISACAHHPPPVTGLVRMAITNCGEISSMWKINRIW